MQDGFFALEFAHNGQALTEAQKQNPEWTSRFSAYVDKIESLSDGDLLLTAVSITPDSFFTSGTTPYNPGFT